MSLLDLSSGFGLLSAAGAIGCTGDAVDAYYAANQLRNEISAEPPIPVPPQVELFKKYFPNANVTNPADSCLQAHPEEEVAEVIKATCDYSIKNSKRIHKIEVKEATFGKKMYEGFLGVVVAIIAAANSWFFCCSQPTIPVVLVDHSGHAHIHHAHEQ